MKILVAIKRALDSSVKARIAADGRSIDMIGAKLAMNPFCEIALEEAIRIKESSLPARRTEVVAVSCSPLQAHHDILRIAIALGADRAMCVDTTGLGVDDPQPLTIARLIHQIAKKEVPDLILCGKQSIDTDFSQTASMIASLLNCNQATAVSKLTISEDGSRISVSREAESGSDILSMSLPAVVSCDLRLNTPRFVSLPKLMKAKKTMIEVITPASLGDIDTTPKLIVRRLTESSKRRKGQILASVSELVLTLQSQSIIPTDAAD